MIDFSEDISEDRVHSMRPVRTDTYIADDNRATWCVVSLFGGFIVLLSVMVFARKQAPSGDVLPYAFLCSFINLLLVVGAYIVVRALSMSVF